MIRKLSLVLIDGAVSVWDRFCREGLSKYPIHPENALFAADRYPALQKRALFPFEEDFPYERQAVFLIKLCRDYAGIILTSGGRSESLQYGPGIEARKADPGSVYQEAGITCAEAAEAADGIRRELTELFDERSEAKAGLEPMIRGYEETEGLLLSEQSPEKRLYYGRLLNEEYTDIFRARQHIYDIDMRIGKLLSSKADCIRQARSCLEHELRCSRLKKQACCYIKNDPEIKKPSEKAGPERHFFLILVMRKRDADRLRKEWSSELDISTTRSEVKKIQDYWQSSEVISLNNYRL